MYISSCTSNRLVRRILADQLRSSAQTELLKGSYTGLINAVELYQDAKDAWTALSSLLGEHQWFFDAERPSLFDASVFAYTNPLLDSDLNWGVLTLTQTLRQSANLVEHRQRVLQSFF